MNSFKIIGRSKDLRTNTDVLYAQVGIDDYLRLVGSDFDKFEIQRKRERHKGYARLRNDIKEGALIPSITLAVKPSEVQQYKHLILNEDYKQIGELLYQQSSIYILDGLQRTHIINDLQKDGVDFRQNQQLLLEFWFEENMENLIYRLIVLNSGQKPMSLRHQVELLFMTMQDRIEADISGIKILNERNAERRKSSKQYSFDRIVFAYNAFLEQSTELKKDNLIVEGLLEKRSGEDNDLKVLDKYQPFKHFLKYYVELDELAYILYGKNDTISNYKNWFSEENVMTAFFAAVGFCDSVPEYQPRIEQAFKSLSKQLGESSKDSDPLDILLLEQIKKRIDPKKFNVGNATRRIIYGAFREFFQNEGHVSMSKCWLLSSEPIIGR